MIDWEGEKIDIEDPILVPNERLAAMERVYFSDIINPWTVSYWGPLYLGWLGWQYDEIVEEINFRRRDKEWV